MVAVQLDKDGFVYWIRAVCGGVRAKQGAQGRPQYDRLKYKCDCPLKFK